MKWWNTDLWLEKSAEISFIWLSFEQKLRFYARWTWKQRLSRLLFINGSEFSQFSSILITMELSEEPSEITKRDPKEFHAVYVRKLSKLQWWLYVGAIFLIFIVLTIIFAKWVSSKFKGLTILCPVLSTFLGDADNEKNKLNQKRFNILT